MPPDNMATDGEPSSTRKKKSKLEKIYELQAANKRLKEENKSLRKQLQTPQKHHNGPASFGNSSTQCDSSTIASTITSSNEEKLLEAMRSLKRVTVKQEQTISTLRSKAEERRRQLAARDEKIAALQHEVDKLKEMQKERKNASSSDDVEALRAKVEELELSNADQESRNKMLTLQLEAAEEQVKKLQFASSRNALQRTPSGRSLKSADTSASEFDMAKMRKELASKIERIVLLEFDLEMCKDELHELRQKHRMDGSHDNEDSDHGGLPDDFSFSSGEDTWND